MEPSGPFTAKHAERELALLERPSQRVHWTTPAGEELTLLVPPTVYPPREDTDLLAAVVHAAGWFDGLRWLEIGSGSGAISLFAAQQGCHITACDVNPMAVVATMANLAEHGCSGQVREGGPGPHIDGDPAQWGGHLLYDRIVWNLPYLAPPPEESQHLGPMEEAGLIDTDVVGLYQRFLHALQRGELLDEQGSAYLVVSSHRDGLQACERAWSVGLAASVCGTTSFEEGEELRVIRLWRPFSESSNTAVDEVDSTNSALLNDTSGVGTTMRAVRQLNGRGRRGRVWDNTSEALLASWVVHAGLGHLHHTLDQVRVGGALTRLFRALTTKPSDVCLKWPNDIFVRNNDDGRWRKIAGVLFEAQTRGEQTRVVLGIGINTTFTDLQDYASLDQIGVASTAEELHVMVHAMVASLYEFKADSSEELQEELAGLQTLVHDGVVNLGPLFYRGKEVMCNGLHPSGELVLNDGHIIGDDPDQLEWSNI